jgi:hypothetical protein
MGAVAVILLAAPLNAATVSIAWDANPEQNLTGYDVCARTLSGSCGSGTFVGNVNLWTFTGLASNIQYRFAVRARNASGPGPWTEIAFTTPPTPPLGSEPTRSDFNGDGWFDLLWQHRTTGGMVAWHLNNTNVVWTRWLTPNAVAAGWKLSGSGDFSRDGKPDLVWHNVNTGQVVYWLMDGAMSYASGFFPGPVASTWRIASVRDLNGDGNADLWWHNQNTGDMVVWYFNGTVFSHAAVPSPARIADTNWKLKGTGDFNRDGQPDALWHNEATGELRVWTLNGITVASAGNLSPAFVAPNWRVAAVGDANLDLWPDIMWQNVATGQLVLWSMSGANLANGAFLSIPAVDPNWEIMGPR